VRKINGTAAGDDHPYKSTTEIVQYDRTTAAISVLVTFSLKALAAIYPSLGIQRICKSSALHYVHTSLTDATARRKNLE
jgi:hypothetical protein